MIVYFFFSLSYSWYLIVAFTYAESCLSFNAYSICKQFDDLCGPAQYDSYYWIT
jgi:hypothetical protein